MSIMFELEALEVQGLNVELRLKLEHPDATGLPVTRNFGLQLLLNFGEESALGREVLAELGVDSPYDWGYGLALLRADRRLGRVSAQS